MDFGLDCRSGLRRSLSAAASWWASSATQRASLHRRLTSADRFVKLYMQQTFLQTCCTYKPAGSNPANKGLTVEGEMSDMLGKGRSWSHIEVIHWHGSQVVVMETIGDWAANEFMVSTFLDAGRLCPNARWIPGQVSWLKLGIFRKSTLSTHCWDWVFSQFLFQISPSYGQLVGANLLCPSATSPVGMWYTSWTLAPGKWCKVQQALEN